MKKLLCFLLVLCMCFSISACGGNTETPSSGSSEQPSSSGASESEEFRLNKAKTFTSFENGKNVIVCFGDSLTYGWGSDRGYDYPAQLETNLNGQYDVINAGIMGEKGDAIMSRANGFEFCLTADVTFPAGSDRVTLKRDLFTAKGAEEPIAYLEFGNELPHDKVIIGGNTYKIEYKATEEYHYGEYTLVRTGNTSSALTLNKGTTVQYDYSEKFDKCEVAIINFGANDGDNGSDALLAKYKKFTEKYDKYIIFVPVGNDETEKKFTDAFGRNAVVVRQEMLAEGFLEKYGQTTVGEDSMAKLNANTVRNKLVPACFRLDRDRYEVHFSPLGNKAIADLIYARGVELGYWK